MSLKIAIDVDDILLNLMDSTLVMFNEKYNKQLTKDDFHYYNIYKCLEFEDADNLSKLWECKELWDTVEPVNGAQCCLKRVIDAGHKIVLATNTHPCNFEWKVKLIEKYFPFVNSSDIIRIRDKSLLNVDVLIDDSLDNLLSGHYWRICLDQPWNRQYDRSTDMFDDARFITRCYSWDEIVDVLNNMDKEW